MDFLVFLLVIVICLFILYILSKQDFVLLRQNISLAEIFDLAFFTILLAFISGRVFFIVNNLRFDLLNPIRFFYLVKFSGFSILGFFLGGALALFLLLRNKKGLGRIYDIFSISFTPIYIFDLVMRTLPLNLFFIPIILFLAITLVLAFFIRSHYKYIFQDGSISLMLLLIISLDTFFAQFLSPQKQFLWSFSLSQIISILFVLLTLIGLLMIQKNSKK